MISVEAQFLVLHDISIAVLGRQVVMYTQYNTDKCMWLHDLPSDNRCPVLVTFTSLFRPVYFRSCHPDAHFICYSVQSCPTLKLQERFLEHEVFRRGEQRVILLHLHPVTVCLVFGKKIRNEDGGILWISYNQSSKKKP